MKHVRENRRRRRAHDNNRDKYTKTKTEHLAAGHMSEKEMWKVRKANYTERKR